MLKLISQTLQGISLKWFHCSSIAFTTPGWIKYKQGCSENTMLHITAFLLDCSSPDRRDLICQYRSCTYHYYVVSFWHKFLELILCYKWYSMPLFIKVLTTMWYSNQALPDFHVFGIGNDIENMVKDGETESNKIDNVVDDTGEGSVSMDASELCFYAETNGFFYVSNHLYNENNLLC